MSAVAEALASLRGRRVAITGATGFIGGRLAEILVEQAGAAVVTLVRQFGSAVRLARHPVEFVRGDVLDGDAVTRAVAGCDVVFHCAYGTAGSPRHRARVNLDGTRRVLEAASAAGVRRLVHLSTLMVYGRTRDGDLDERAPRRRFGNAYSDSKLLAERLAMRFARRRHSGLEVAVLQPTAVYGPWGGVWTAAVLASLRRGRQPLIDGGEGLANAVYVDDLVAAMLLAATRPEASGEAFLVSDGRPVPWREFYAHFARIAGVGPEALVTLTEPEALALWRASRRAVPSVFGEGWRLFTADRALRERLMASREAAWARDVASRLLPEAAQLRIKEALGGGGRRRAPETAQEEPPVLPVRPEMIDFYRPKTAVRIDKARRLLGYEPAFDLERGMAFTAAWARWAGLV